MKDKYCSTAKTGSPIPEDCIMKTAKQINSQETGEIDIPLTYPQPNICASCKKQLKEELEKSVCTMGKHHVAISYSDWQEFWSEYIGGK